MAKKNNNPKKYVSKKVVISGDVKVTMPAEVRENLCRYYVEKILVADKKSALREEIKTLDKSIKAVDNQIKALIALPLDDNDTKDATNLLIEKFKASKREFASDIELIKFKISKLASCKLANTVIDLDKDANINLYKEYCKLCNGGKNTLATKTSVVLKAWGVELTESKLLEFTQLVNGINSKVVLDTDRVTKAMPYKKYLVRFFDVLIDFLISFNADMLSTVKSEMNKIIEDKVDSLTIEDYLQTIE